MAIRNGLKVGQLGVTLIVRDAAAAADFYKDVLGAEEIHRHVTADGAGVHGIELKLGEAHLTLATENPNLTKAPRPDWPRSPHSAGTTTAFFTVYVDDVDAVVARALAAGATSPNGRDPVQDTHWGDRVGQFVDPAGHVWRLQTAKEEVVFEELPTCFEALRAAHSARAAQRAAN